MNREALKKKSNDFTYKNWRVSMPVYMVIDIAIIILAARLSRIPGIILGVTAILNLFYAAGILIGRWKRELKKKKGNKQ